MRYLPALMARAVTHGPRLHGLERVLDTLERHNPATRELVQTIVAQLVHQEPPRLCPHTVSYFDRTFRGNPFTAQRFQPNTQTTDKRLPGAEEKRAVFLAVAQALSQPSLGIASRAGRIIGLLGNLHCPGLDQFAGAFNRYIARPIFASSPADSGQRCSNPIGDLPRSVLVALARRTDLASTARSDFALLRKALPTTPEQRRALARLLASYAGFPVYDDTFVGPLALHLESAIAEVLDVLGQLVERLETEQEVDWDRFLGAVWEDIRRADRAYEGVVTSGLVAG